MKIHCLHDKLVSVKDLKQHPKNRNKHPSDQIKRLAEILKYQGWRYPIKVSKRSGFITSGHGRLEAAHLNGWKEVPINFQDYESDEQEYADVQADNAIANWSELDLSSINADLAELGPDFKLDMLGIKDFVLEPSEKFDPGCDEDDVPEKVEPKTKLGDLYKLGNHRLLCGDSTNIQHVDRLMDGTNPEMAYCDPPYGANIVNQNGTIGENKPFGNIGNMVDKAVKAGVYAPIIGDESTETAKASFNICSTISKTQIFWGAQYYAETLPPNSGWIVWDKETDGSLGDGELAYSNLKKAIRIFKHKWSGMIKASEHGQRRVHPTQKPIALAEWCFENYGDPKTVLDLFGGSGSTLIACEKSKRKCFIMEMSPEYCDVIVSRWEKYTGKKSELING